MVPNCISLYSAKCIISVVLLTCIIFAEVKSDENALYYFFKDLASVHAPSTSRPIKIDFDLTYFNDAAHSCTTANDSVEVGQPTSSATCPTEMEWTDCHVECTEEYLMSDAMRDEIQNVYLPKAVTYLQRGVHVRAPLDGLWKVDNTTTTTETCGSVDSYAVEIPDWYFTSGVKKEADLVIFVTMKPMQNDLTSFGVDCLRESDGTGRPKLGIINLSPSRIKVMNSKIRHLIIAHELLHIMGFSSRIYGDDIVQYERSANGGSKKVSTLRYSRLVDVAREYYACPTMNHVELENYGDETMLGEKSWLHTKDNHWEERVMRSELMTGGFTSRNPVDPSISVITLALLESMGWYWVDYHEYMHDYSYGRGYGCDFVNKDCSAWQLDTSFRSGYFCNGKTDAMACSFDQIHKAACEDIFHSKSTIPEYYHHFDDTTLRGYNAHADYCTNFHPTTTNCRFDTGNSITEENPFGEKYSMHSGCFVGDARKSVSGQSPQLSRISRCHEFACENGTTLYIKVDSVWITCPAAGGKYEEEISGFQGTITCPPVDVLCPFNLTTDNFDASIKNPETGPNVWQLFITFLQSIHFGVWIAIGCVIAIVAIIIFLIMVLLIIRYRRSRRWKVKRVVDVEEENKELDELDMEH